MMTGRDCKDCRHCEGIHGFMAKCQLDLVGWFVTRHIKQEKPRNHARACELYEEKEAEK